jgi:hypothetical protein
MLRAFVIMVVLLALYACATPERCAERQFFKAFVDGKPNPNRYFPGVAELQLHEDVTLRLSICNRDAADALCVEIYPTEDIAFQFVEPRVTMLYQAANSRAVLPFKKITYNVVCHGPSLAEKDADCESSTASPLVGSDDLQKSRVRASKIGANFYYLDAYEFPPDATFKGAMVSATLLTKIRRKYEAVTQPFQPSLTDELIVAIPKVRIGSRAVDVPESSFKYVTENVCLPNRPLSLQ